MATEIVAGIILGLGFYLFGCLVLFKICEKFGVGSLFECCIPIYNMILLCRCADISGWNVLWYILPGAFSRGKYAIIGALISITITVVIWGRIAERMGRSFWQYGLGTAFLLGIPALVLAFGPARPSRVGVVQAAAREGDFYVPPEPIYKPLPAYERSAPIGQSASAVGQSSASIYCYMGELKGNTIPIPSQGVIIGRDPAKCQIVLSSNELSRLHASITPDLSNPHNIILRDMQSTNGTFQQTRDIEQGSRWERIKNSVVLVPGMRFRVGKGVAEFEVR